MANVLSKRQIYAPLSEKLKEHGCSFSEKDPDVLLFFKWIEVTPKYIKDLKIKFPKIKTVLLFGDQRGGKIPKYVQERKGLIDALLINNNCQKQAIMYKNFGIKIVEPFYPLHWQYSGFLKNTPNKNVVFGGSNFGVKKFPLSSFRKELVEKFYKVFKMDIYGNGWSPLKTNKVLSNRDLYLDVLSNYCINLGVNHYSVKQYYDRRLFDGLSSGRLHLTHYVPGMEEDFENHKHLVWFKSVDEGISLTKKYLASPERCTEIGISGNKRMEELFSMEKRANHLIGVFKKLGVK